MKKITLLGVGLLLCFSIVMPCFADQTIVAKKVAQAPAIDGIGDDPAWVEAQEYTTDDIVANIPMTFKVIYTDTEIFFFSQLSR